MSTTIAQRPPARFPGKAMAAALAGLALAAGIGFAVRTNTADNPAQGTIQHTVMEQAQKSNPAAVANASEVAGITHYPIEQVQKSNPPAQSGSATLTDREAFKYYVVEGGWLSQTASAGVLEQASPGLMEGTG